MSVAREHADHEIVATPDGTVVAIGYRPYGPALATATIVEFYDPTRNEWRLGATRPAAAKGRAGQVPHLGAWAAEEVRRLEDFDHIPSAATIVKIEASRPKSRAIRH